MAGIYLHIPFCDKACPYCDFYFLVSKQRIPEFIEAIISEIKLRKKEINEAIESIYFGGGTPSCLAKEELLLLMNAIEDNFEIDDQVEVTFEMNPEHVSAARLHELHDAGINRLSLGIQSFHDAELKQLGRQHDRAKALDCMRLVADSKIKNYSVDLIMGLPGQSVSNWEQNLAQAIEFKPPHLSVYSLTVEPGTSLEHRIQKGQEKPIDPELQASLYSYTYEELNKASYEAYEISNYSLSGKQSRHNSSYWKGIYYLGLGPSAHSFINAERYSNPADLKSYLEAMTQGKLASVKEDRTETNKLNEDIMIGLRLAKGLDLNELSKKYGEYQLKRILKLSKAHEDSGHLLNDNNVLTLSLSGRLISDRISLDLFEDENDS